MNALVDLRKRKQSVWLDYIRRDLIRGGDLKRMIEQDGVSGVTSNPTIFEMAIDGSDQYDEALRQVSSRHPPLEPSAIYDEIAIEDVRAAADALRPVFEASGGADGFVSIEPPPQLVGDTAGNIQEARRLYRMVSRPNLMIKVAAVQDGVTAVEKLIAEGLNINITLIFSLHHYEAVANAYIRGLAQCNAPDRVASVASVFVSRVDTQVDKELGAIGSPEAMKLKGKIAIANARVIYRRFREIFASREFSELRGRGARVQRPLWASTGTKNPAYSDVLYVEQLIGPDTVSTIPPATLASFRDHGCVRGDTVLENELEAESQIRALSECGIDLDSITDNLQMDGLRSFASAYDHVLDAIGKKLQVLSRVPV